MFTTTNNEKDCLSCDVSGKYRDIIHSLIDNVKLGIPYKHALERADELQLYVYTLGYWEQDRFTYLSHINYINDYDLRSIYKRSREI